MDERLVDLRSSNYREARIKIMQGHFATQNSHINTYIDMSTVKCRQNNASVCAKALAENYMNTLAVDTIVCLDETEVIGAFMADELSHTYKTSLSYGNNISVITPEVNSMGQMIFRDNKQRMVEGMRVLILTDSITSGKTILQAIDSVLYYGGKVGGIAAIFSAVTKCTGIEVKSIFSVSDIPNYGYYTRDNCPMCAKGQRIEALVNGFGYSEL
ncbi:MAG: orotate phosphoribosyltransferase [Lachnospiraceae bacterium]|nr:orotate phosphoribosyltransferase [Lachnospiraceae bacterium]